MTWRAAAIRARLRRAALEAALAEGRDPWTEPELMLCAARLTAASTRRKLADAIDGAIVLAEHGRPTSALVGLRGTAVLAERDALRDMADRLRAPAPVSVVGVARVARLLWQPGSPLYVDGDDAALRDALDRCRQALEASCPVPS